jgi:hypothetical protein
MMNQLGVSSNIKQLAERLVAFEAAAQNSSKDDAHATCRVCEKLRRPLTTLTGTAGFTSVLSRALTLAKREAPALRVVQVRPDGSMEGFSSETAKAHPVLVAYLLKLLVTFIGEVLTTRLLTDIWPDVPALEFSSPRDESK